jgi:inositol-hexakisphosphate kinase
VEVSQLVDVRIIDFAHSTHKGLKDSTLHNGPDEGFIYGIENFISILEEIKTEKDQLQN